MRIARLAGLCLLLASLITLLPMGPVLAQEESIELVPFYSKLEATYPGASFQFEVEMPYQGSSAREFDLSVSGPQGWTITITPFYGTQNIRSIRLQPNQEFPDSVKVTAAPSVFSIPEPREYDITLEAVSGSLQASVDLAAVITATYSISLISANQLLNTTATVGEDNFYSIVIQNVGTGTIEDISFSSDKPSNWGVEFYPTNLDELLPGQGQTIEVNIKPAPKTISGDYQISLFADSRRTSEYLDLRVTVQTPTVWGWVGIIIILVVVAGVTFIFLRFSRR